MKRATITMLALCLALSASLAHAGDRKVIESGTAEIEVMGDTAIIGPFSVSGITGPFSLLVWATSDDSVTAGDSIRLCTQQTFGQFAGGKPIWLTSPTSIAASFVEPDSADIDDPYMLWGWRGVNDADSIGVGNFHVHGTAVRFLLEYRHRVSADSSAQPNGVPVSADTSWTFNWHFECVDQ